MSFEIQLVYRLQSTCLILFRYAYFSLDNKIYIEFATLHCITQSFLPQDKMFVEILYCWHRVCSLYRISISYSEFCIVDKSEQEYFFTKQVRSPNVTKLPYMTSYVFRKFASYFIGQYIKVKRVIQSFESSFFFVSNRDWLN